MAKADAKSTQKQEIAPQNLEDAVEAAYQLGLIDGKGGIKPDMLKIKVRLQSMLATNKEIFKLLLEENRQDRRIQISTRLCRGLMRVCKEFGGEQACTYRLTLMAYLDDYIKINPKCNIKKAG